MKHFRFARLLPWLLIAVCPPLLGHCGGALEHGTETGNPPVVEQQKLHVVLHDDGVEVVGEAGSVSPGATVTVTNTRSGDHAEAIARADGSVNVRVPGTLDDEYEVTVASGGGSQSVRVKAANESSPSATNSDAADTGVDNTTDTKVDNETAGSNATLSDAELSSASCDVLENTLAQRVASAFGSGDTQCRTDDDCVYANWGAACYYQCGSSFLSVNGATQAQADAVQSTAPVCNELQSRCLRQPPSSCPPLPSTMPQCSNGVCQALDLSSYSCEQLSNTALARLDTALTGAARECMQDADCTLYNPSLSCAFSCPGHPSAVAVSALTALNASSERIESRICSEFQNRACSGPFALPCPAPVIQPKAVCSFPSSGAPGTPGQCTLTSTQL